MNSQPGQRIRLGRSAIVVLALTLGVLWSVGSTGAAAAPAPAAGPQLSIAVDNGRTSVKKGDALSYTVTVRNLGDKKISHLQVTQTMPAGMSFTSADSRGTEKAGTIGWQIDVKAGATRTLHSKAMVTTTPDALLRLATVACATVSSKGPPIVCASHSDELPAGAAAASVAAGAGSSSSTLRTWWLALAAVVVLGAGATLLLVRRRRGSLHPA